MSAARPPRAAAIALAAGLACGACTHVVSLGDRRDARADATRAPDARAADDAAADARADAGGCGDACGDWTVLPSGTTAALTAVFARAHDDAWVVGDGAATLHWDGAALRAIASPGAAGRLAAVWASGPADVWVGGEGGAWRWDGAAWRAVDPSRLAGYRVWALAGRGPGEVWLGVTGAAADAHLARWTGAQVELVEALPREVREGAVTAPAMRDFVLVSYEGGASRWGGAPPLHHLSMVPATAAGRGWTATADEAWFALADGTVGQHATISAETFQAVDTGATQPLRAITGAVSARGTALWAVGARGTIVVRAVDGRWEVTAPGLTDADLSAVAVAADDAAVFAVGARGVVLRGPRR